MGDSFFESTAVKSIAVFILGGALSCSASLGLVLYVWNGAQTRADEDRAVIRRHGEAITVLQLEQALTQRDYQAIQKTVDAINETVKSIDRTIAAEVKRSK